MNQHDIIRDNILHSRSNKTMMDRLADFRLSKDERNKIYTEEKEKYGEYFKLVKLKSQKYAFLFTDNDELQAAPDDMGVDELKEIYCIISKDLYVPEQVIIQEEV